MLSIPKKVVYDEKGKPVEVILSWEDYQKIEEILGLDLDEEAIRILKEAKADREQGKKDAYVSLEEI